MTEQIGITDIFKKVSLNSQKLLLSMAHFSENGAKKTGAIATSGLEAEELDKALNELKQFNVIQYGSVLTEGHEQTFVIGEGERFRLAPDAKESVYKDILKMEQPKPLFNRLV